jgi:hypothetical protein
MSLALLVSVLSTEVLPTAWEYWKDPVGQKSVSRVCVRERYHLMIVLPVIVTYHPDS